MTDPYQVLEVSKSASHDEIKKSYRKLAKKFHPDFNPGNKEAEKKFKNVQHAFDQVGTPEARAKWDRGETDEQKQKQYDDFMKQQTGGGAGGRSYYYNTQDDGGRYSYSFGQAFEDEDLFESLFGGKAKKKRAGNVIYQMEVEFKEAALGAEKLITLPNGKKVQVKIPAGIDNGNKLKFKGLGEAGIDGGPPGDAYIEIRVRPLSGFTRKGADLETEVSISFYEALLGGEVRVPTLDGAVMVKVPSGTSSGAKLRISGKGAGEKGHRGNILVTLKVVMPKDIPNDVIKSIQALRVKFDYNPRGRDEHQNDSRAGL